MLLLLGFSCLLVASHIQANKQGLGTENAEVVNSQTGTKLKDFWKTMFTTYYDVKGLRNETTDKLVESFFEHEFESYPKELYPAFKRIFVHISKSNDRIWNFYESILYLYHNVDAADSIYETVLRRLALGKLLEETRELDLDDTFPLDESSESEESNMQHRSGVIFEEEQVPDFELPCDDCGIPPLQVGSIRAIPGEHFPNYDEIPITSFTCAEKHIPGFYADLETGCQVFHVCYPHRRESFLCPIGTIFNQAILACDYWYSSNCSLAPLYFISDPLTLDEYLTEGKETFVDHLLEQHGTLDTTSTVTQHSVVHPTREPEEEKPGKPASPKIKITLPNIDWTLMIKFLPIKSKIMECTDLCETETTSYPTKSTTIAEPTVEEYTTRPVSSTPPVATVPPKKDEYTTSRPVVTRVPLKKDEYTTTTTARPFVETPEPTKEDKYGEKSGKSEILLDILKAVKLLTKDAEGFLTKAIQMKHEHHDKPAKKPTVTPRQPIEKPKPFPEINPRFVVKPAEAGRYLPRPKVSRSKPLKPSKQILKSQVHDTFRSKEPAKLVLEGMKAFSHLFD